jgi:hypothetical protein
MRQFRRIAVGAAALLALGLGVAVYAHPGMGFGPQGFGPGSMGPGFMRGMGPPMMMRGAFGGAAVAPQLMTPEEQQALFDKMRNAATIEERQKLAEANRAEMEKRAKEKGITLPQFRGPMQQGDAAFGTDMRLVHDMVLSHDRIKRTVTNLPDGIRTVTESDDPQVAQTLKAHVASMAQRLDEGRVFNLFSPTLPVLFANKDKIRTQVEATDKGAVVTQTSSDAAVIAALQAHAVEVSELARDGRIAMMRSARAAMATMARGPGAGLGPNFAPPLAATAR